MKAVILAGGEGVRMRPLTNDKPKQLVFVAGRPILDHILDALPPAVTEAIIVVGYRGDQIRERYGSSYRGLPITYVAQTEKKGTMHALRQAEPHLHDADRFLVMYADDIHGADGLKACVEKGQLALTVKTVENPAKRFGVVEVDANGRAVNLVEKPEHPRSNLISTGVFVLDKNVFRYHPELLKGEEYLAEAVACMIRDGHAFYAVHAPIWIPIGYPEDIEAAEKFLQESEKSGVYEA